MTETQPIDTTPNATQQEIQTHTEKKINFAKRFAFLPASILLGSIIIAAAIVFGSYVIGTSLSHTTPLLGTANQTAPGAAQAATQDPVTVTDRANEPTLGNSNAKVTVMEFGDFQCPFCKQFYQQTFSAIKSSYIDTGKIKYVFRDFPLTQIHVNAQIAAVAAECANQQNKFWDYHNLLYTNGQSDGTNLDKASLEKYATQLGLNSSTFGFVQNKFNQCLESNATLATVQGDEAEGVKDGITGTPSFLIIKNGQTQIDVDYIKNAEAQNQSVVNLPNGDVFLIGAQPASAFSQAIDAALKN